MLCRLLVLLVLACGAFGKVEDGEGALKGCFARLCEGESSSVDGEGWLASIVVLYDVLEVLNVQVHAVFTFGNQQVVDFRDFKGPSASLSPCHGCALVLTARCSAV